MAKKTSPRRARKTSPRRARKTSPRRARKTSPRRARKTSPRRARKTSPRRARKTSPRRARKTSPRRARSRRLGMPGRDMGGRDMGGRDMGGRDMGGRDMGGRDTREPEVEVLKPSPGDFREYKHIMRKHKNINKRAQIFVQYFHRCLTSVIEKNTDRHAADAMGGIRINHISNHEAAYDCGFDEEDFLKVLDYIYVQSGVPRYLLS